MPLTNAEKQARFRAKRDAELERLRKLAAGQTAKATDDSALAAARAEIERLKAALASQHEATPVGDANAELAAARVEITLLKGRLAAKAEFVMPRNVEELLERRRLIKEADKIMRAQEKAAKAAKKAAQPEAAPLSPEEEKTLQERLANAEQQLKAKTTQIKNLRSQLIMYTGSPHRMSKKLHRQVLTLLHPDRVAHDDPLHVKLTKAFQDFSAIKFKFPADE